MGQFFNRDVFVINQKVNCLKMANEYIVMDNHAQPIGKITKQWGGLLKEIFTDADKYMVTFSRKDMEYHKKVAIISAAITIDMVLKERKN